MKQKINGRLLLIALLSMGLTLLLSIVVFKTAFEKQVKGDIRQSAEVMAAGYSTQPDEALLDAYAAAGYRITLIRGDGTVLYDSKGDAETMENHRDRPEVASALQNGAGEAVRTSATLGYNTYYYAVALPDGSVLRAARDTASLYLLYHEALPWLFIIVAALVVMSVVLSAYLTKQLVQPIEAMAERLGEDEPDLAVPYPELTPFAATLKDNQRRLKETERIRQEFTANVSHELKTPMTSISGYAEMIETGLAKPEDVRNFAGKIRFEAARLISLIGDIILLSELDDPAAARKFGPVDLFSVAKGVTEYLTFNAGKNNIKLSVTGGQQTVRGSQGLLEELIYNLCDNAIRYNRPGGKVVVDVSGRDGKVWLSVSDTGIGIPPEHQDRIFERFYRVDKSHSKETGGTGLGLAIVKHIALSHGGKITVSSKVGVGTQIKIGFPMFQEQPSQAEKPTAPGDKSKSQNGAREQNRG